MKENIKAFIFILAIAFMVVPAMIVSGFFPAWYGLPFYVWVLIAALGTGILLGLLVPQWYKGFISGAVLSLGVLFGIYYYVIFRTQISGSANILRIEIALGFLIGMVPGAILFFKWGLKK